MARAEVQELIAKLTLQDQLSGQLAAAKQNLTATETQLGRVAATSRATGQSLGFLGSSLGQAAAAGVAAFAVFKGIEFLSDSVQAAREEEVGIARLTASLKANIPAWNEDTLAVEKAIAAREQFGFSDDSLRTSLGSLVAVTHNVNAALDVQNTAMDLARFKNVSLEEATTALVTVEAGRYRGLAQLGIVIKAGASQTEALAAVQKVAGGQAEAFGETTQGAFDRASVAIHNLQETIGAPLLDALALVAQAAADAAKSLEDFIGEAQSLIDTAADLKQHAQDTAPRIIGLADAIDFVTGAFHAARDPAERLTAQAVAAGAAAAAAEGSFTTLTGVLQELAPATEAANGVMLGLAAAQAEAQSKAESLGPRFDNLNGDIDRFVSTTEGGVEAVGNLIDALDRIPRNIDINFQFGLSGAVNAGLPPGSADTNRGSTFTSGGSQAALDQHNAAVKAQAELDAARRKAAEDAARKSEQAASEAAAKAKQRAEELARAYRDKVSVEFDHAKKTADTLFDALHDRITKAIKDAENLAQKNHDAAVQAISDNLKAEEAKHAQPVNAAEKALADRQAEEQRRNLVEAQQAAAQAARTNTDPTRAADLARALRDATEALANFDAQAAIDRLKVVQAGQDAASQAASDKATAAEDAKLQAAKDQAQKQQDAETIAAKKRKDDFEAQLAALEARDQKAGKTIPQIDADIAALEKRFGITTDKLGFHHIEDPLVTAIKAVKIDPPQVTVSNNQNYLLQAGAQELRLIASALTTGNQPAATSSVRTGAGGRN